MQITINLTVVLVTLIVCAYLYAMCKMARQDKAEKKQQKGLKGWDFMNHRNNMRVVSSTQERGLREYVEDQVKKGEGKQ